MDNLLPQDTALSGLPIFGILILGIILHELIHGLTWPRLAGDDLSQLNLELCGKCL